MSPRTSSPCATSDARNTAWGMIQQAPNIGKTARRFHPLNTSQEALVGVTVGNAYPAGMLTLATIQGGVKYKSAIVNKGMHCSSDDG